MSSRIEEMIQILNEIPRASFNERIANTLIERRLHLTRSQEGEHELFIEGERDSFGNFSEEGVVSWNVFHEVGTNREISALVIRIEDRTGHARLLSHVAYESERVISENPDIDNREVLRLIDPFLSLIIQSTVMSTQKQMGLTGELIFLEQLLQFCDQKKIPHSRAVGAWKGHSSSDRDFYSNGVAIEVKASGSSNRTHKISSLEQLLPNENPPEERIIIYSIGLSPDSSREYKLVTQIDNVTNLLSVDLHREFFDCLENYCGHGYHRDLRRRYEQEKGFSVSPPGALIEIGDDVGILRYTDFVGGSPPNAVEHIQYSLNLGSNSALDRGASESLFATMLS